jgi:hypothetical protein
MLGLSFDTKKPAKCLLGPLFDTATTPALQFTVFMIDPLQQSFQEAQTLTYTIRPTPTANQQNLMEC